MVTSYSFTNFNIYTVMKTKDIVILVIASVILMPIILVFNENMEAWWINLLGLACIGLLALAARTNIGKMFIKRMERIEDKLFGKVGG